ncbi:MAG: Holliday junction branch migration protein RuvA [Lachnospiraceae bacterium]|nr:Holliday junction branch migration protein RuvA [Lachnospiraceae bacterium]
MFAYVKGIVMDITQDCCVIDVHDVGINIHISAQTAARMPGIGQEAKLYTYTSVREDAFWLYGFLSKGDLEMFKRCITVSGIGPKGALGLLSVMDGDQLRFAILAQDVKAISKAPGIGKRTAERLVLELKDKLDYETADISREIADGSAGGAGAVMDHPGKREAVEALVALGYGQTEAMKAVSQVEGADDMDSSALLKQALKKMF